MIPSIALALVALALLWQLREQRKDSENLTTELIRDHRTEVAQLNQARMEETANLLQRIQAPEQAVTSHVADNAQPDPPPLQLENDEEMLEAYRRRIEGIGG